MSELHHRYAGRVVADWVRQPPFAELEGRARRRVHRLRAVRVAGGAVAVAVLAVPALAIPGGLGPVVPGGDDPAPESMFGHSVAFLDLQHGVAQHTDLSQGPDCRSWVSVTADGGSTWSEWRPQPELDRRDLDWPETAAPETAAPGTAAPGTAKPESDGPESDGPESDGPESDRSGAERPATAPPPPDPEEVCFASRVIPVGPETLVVPATTQTLSRLEWVDPPDTAYLSRDGGLTWQEYQPQERTASAVPDRVVPEARCLDGRCEQTRLSWWDPQTGDRMLLADNPPAAQRGGITTSVAVAADGSIWAAGADPDGGYLVSVSQDRGRNWQTESLPGSGPAEQVLLATVDGRTGYLAVREPDGSPGPLYRTGDGGQEWQPVPGGTPDTSVYQLWMSPTGTLVVVDPEGQAYRSDDRGGSFQAAQLPVWEIQPVVDGFIGWGLDDSPDPVDAWLSPDGLTWQPVQVPAP